MPKSKPRPKAEKKLTILRRNERADKILTRLASEGFRRRDITKALRTKPEKIAAIRRHVRQGKATREDVERLAKAQSRLEKRFKAELPARRARQEVKVIGLNYADVAGTTGLDPKEASRLLKRAKAGKLEPGDLKKIRESLHDFKLKNVYTMHDEAYGDMVVFPNKTQARRDGRAHEMIKEFSDTQMAFEWWKGIGQGAKYFICVANPEKGQFQLWDTRTHKERTGRKR